MNFPTNMGLAPIDISNWGRKQCERYCPKHPMSRCGGVLNHRGFHQCSECEIEGIRKQRTDNADNEIKLRYFEYR